MLSALPAQPPHIPAHDHSAPIVAPISATIPEPCMSEPRTVDELMRSRASTDPDLPLVAYPSTGIQYVDYTARQLDTFAYRAAEKYATLIPSRTSSSQKPTVVALVGRSNLDYLITLLALSKLGHTVMFLSTRNSKEAQISLLEKTACHHMVVDSAFAGVAGALQEDKPDLHVLPITTRESYEYPLGEPIDTRMNPTFDPEQEAKNVCWIIHSSGSTGLPKPIFLTQKAVLKNYSTNMNMRGFITLPLFHAHGISSLFRTVYCKKQIHLYNAELPLTKQYLTEIIRTHDFKIFYGVPYALSLLAESAEGIELLSRFKIVMFGGSSCPDSLGHKLVAHGVNLVSHYGSTETGQLMTSFRPQGDKGWDYLRPTAAVTPFLRFEDQGSGLYECVCLEGWPSKVMTNREDGAYATKDCFTKHPTLPNAWKYYCRLDDTITLNNGEKANPLQLEGAAKESPLVADAVMFGAGRTRCGLAVVLSAEAAGMSENMIVDAVLKTVEPAHTALPAHAKIDRDMMLLLPPETQYRITDKGTVIRQAFYKQFEQEIDAMYEEKTAGTLVLSEPDLRDFVMREVAEVMEKDHSSLTDDQDFFSLGMDSLQTSRLRTTFLKQLDLGGQQLGLNCVFDYPSVSALAHHLHSLRNGADVASVSKEEEMQALIEQYSTFRDHVPQPRAVEGDYVLVTGATGSLGAHIVAQLAALPSVHKVYCLVRATSPSHALARVIKSLQARRLHPLPPAAEAKLVALPADLSRQDLGLSPDVLDALKTELSAVIHAAWSVNFNLALRSFEKDCIAGVTHLLNLCLATRSQTPASFNFCSSVSSVVNTPAAATDADADADADASSLLRVPIPESLPPTLSSAQNMGYAQSKLVAEHLVARAGSQHPTLRARVLRIGQVIGDTKHGVWSAAEAVPLMLRAAVTIGVLPTLEERVRWLPVDVVAGSCVEIGGIGAGVAANESAAPSSSSSASAVSSSSGAPTTADANAAPPSGTYNITNPRTVHWTQDVLPLLRGAGLAFEAVGTADWLETLRQGPQDPVANPPVKLLEFWERKYGDGQRRELVYRTERAEKWARGVRDAGVLDAVLVRRVLAAWRGAWGLGEGK
ncbi:uncharacterized protein K452DRAFT_147401 [Aplosporella prunicola CBS 121167]|uniref:Carrier domain-containing protein n=1 Tax=Aplosporella prunicola CBS 121167 TaxID=1176127 RepID=A0A6A6BNG8_9PEZI|nr:uncharacterized protein K452DRAFT_147401 [Aplosporella prunicola CBS 121167]KAF2144784.1 hypothetical protein K452DRAFT_147401 [Aplosporella prunicola CBS 121167]